MELASVPTNKIEVSGRARREFSGIKELAEDIRENGLINPLTLKRNSDDTYTLLAGERRLRACNYLSLSEVPARVYDRELSERERLCIELSENVQRKDFLPVEEVALRKRIHDLHVAEFGPKVARSADAEGWSGADTAKFLGISRSEAARDLGIAGLVEQFPDLGWDQCKTKADMRRLADKFKNHAVVTTRVKEVEAERSEGKLHHVVQRMMDAYIVGDFFEHAKEVDSSTFNLIEIDPPYAIELRETKKGYGYGADYNEVVRNKYPEFLAQTIKESYRLLKPGGWLLLWFAPEPWFNHCYELLRSAHLETHRMCGVWTKPTGQAQQPTTRLANCYEMFFYARKGDARLQKPGRSNVYSYSPVHPSRKVHPTERPLELMQEVLQTFALPGDRVLVPFAGSGATLRAAFSLGMKAVGFDLTENYRNAYVAQIAEDYSCPTQD